MSRPAKLHLLHATECHRSFGARFIFECGLTICPAADIPFTNDILILDSRPPETVCKKCLRAAIKKEKENG